jgi:hypothetical protein
MVPGWSQDHEFFQGLATSATIFSAYFDRFGSSLRLNGAACGETAVPMLYRVAIELLGKRAGSMCMLALIAFSSHYSRFFVCFLVNLKMIWVF